MLIQGLSVFIRVDVVLGMGFGKNMVTRKIILCAEKHVFVIFPVQHAIDGSDGRDADRSGRQTIVLIGIIGRIWGVKMILNSRRRHYIARVGTVLVVAALAVISLPLL